MNSFKAESSAGMVVESAGIIGFALAWIGLSVRVAAVSVYTKSPVGVAPGRAIAFTLPIIGTVLFTAEDDRFRRIAHWTMRVAGRGCFHAW